MLNRTFKIHCSQIGKIMGSSKPAGNLSVTCKTFLKEWYANEYEEIHSKYIDKGNQVENELIDFMAIQLGYGMAEKNTTTLHDEFMVGTCDVDFPDLVVDVKAPYNRKTLHDNVDGINSDYEWQLQGYMNLYNKPKAILFYGLMDTPETDWTPEVIYSDMPEQERWLAYSVTRNDELIQSIKDRVLMCRAWLEEYDILVKGKLGRVNEN